uniref:Uncharacterized protein n=1 Tax=Rousettus aegyptiacus TaxID=9407 RepID=A0A7J8DXS8_ROUAE|nr:hypothetical protein HJG63_008359 [Rousettus aegyptiacus]
MSFFKSHCSLSTYYEQMIIYEIKCNLQDSPPCMELLLHSIPRSGTVRPSSTHDWSPGLKPKPSGLERQARRPRHTVIRIETKVRGNAEDDQSHDTQYFKKSGRIPVSIDTQRDKQKVIYAYKTLPSL